MEAPRPLSTHAHVCTHTHTHTNPTLLALPGRLGKASWMGRHISSVLKTSKIMRIFLKEGTASIRQRHENKVFWCKQRQKLASQV